MKTAVFSGSYGLEEAAPTGAPTLVCPLADATEEREVGGKARNLARLIALSVPVPEGVVLTRQAFEGILRVRHLRTFLESSGVDLNSADADQFPGISERIRAELMNTPLPPEIQWAIDAIARELSSVPVLAVRSSAVGEDGAHASFAGQFDSILGVTTKAGLEDAVRACWASYWSERALSYRTARQVTTGGMGVIVQRQVRARLSGVLFTRSPGGITGSKADDLIIEYCAGLGDRLVSGSIDPGRVIVSRTDLAVRRASTPENQPQDEDPTGFFPVEQILNLARMALRLERELGGPQDIEWSIDYPGQLWILQARPITIVPTDNTSTEGSVLWSNANVNENFPEPISPLLYSIASLGYRHYFRNLGLAFGLSRRRLAMMERPLDAIIGVHGARMYYNLTSIHAVLRMAPFGTQLTGAFNQFTGADEVAAQPSGATSWRTPRGRIPQLIELTRIGIMTAWQYMFLRRRIESFERTVDDYAAHTKARKLSERTLTELLEDLHSFLDIRCHRWKNASLADAASMVCYALLRQALAGTDEPVGLHNRLLRALPGVPSSIPPLRLWELSRLIRSDQPLQALFATRDATGILAAVRSDARFIVFRRAFDQFLEEWGFRSSAELMLTIPSMQENPIPAIELLKSYAASDGEAPEVAIARQTAERIQETSRVLRRLIWRSPFKAARVSLLLRWTQRAVAYRERARLKQALLYNRCRLLALAIGNRFVHEGMLHDRDEVFMLTWQEICEFGSGRAMFPYHVSKLVASRRREHAELGSMRLPDAFRLREGHYCPADKNDHTTTVTRMAEARSTLYGTGASGGVVTARTAVLGDVRESGRLKGGEVLVTRQTDPGWAPVFGLISGLVIERGGMLSHGAIIAREFGLPCVVGIKNATRRIAHGIVVTVDGDRGACTIGAHPSEPQDHGDSL